jgi:Protein of unknown function (DUF1761)
VELNYLAILVAAVAAFVASMVWYAPFGRKLAELNPAYADAGRPPAWKIGVELARNLVLATVFAGVAEEADGLVAALLLGLALWVGFPVVLWAGAISWENVPPKLAAIHAGDWLVKLLVVAVIVGVWR